MDMNFLNFNSIYPYMCRVQAEYWWWNKKFCFRVENGILRSGYLLKFVQLQFF